jgi:hypothetical protein
MKIFGKIFRVAHCRSQEKEALLLEEYYNRFSIILSPQKTTRLLLAERQFKIQLINDVMYYQKGVNR